MEYRDNLDKRDNCNLNREENLNSPQLGSNYNRFAMLSRVMDNKSCYNLDNENMLREVTINIRLERINTQERVTIEVLLDNVAMRLVISLEFSRKQGSQLKKIEKLIYVRNMDGSFNKKRLIEHTVEVNISRT